MGIKKISAFAAAVALSMTVLGGCSNDKKDAAAVKYDWSNVAIGGGGYITDLPTSAPISAELTALIPIRTSGCR